MAAAGFWDDQEQAQEQVAELRRVNFIIKPLAELSSGAGDLEALLELAAEDDSGETEAEISSTLARLTPRVDALELQATMSAPEDACDAFLTVQAGEGGNDSADWAEMLLRMYLRWAERNDYKAEVLERSDGEVAGIRNATIAVRGDYAYGYLKGENGNHRLIRISPFDAAGRRQTSFAAVDVTPDLGERMEIDIDWDKDVREDTFRAGGAGGQHVNKTDSAIRLTHFPTGVVVQCQNERSQHKNRAMARKMLIAKLHQMQQEQQDAELAARRGEKSKIGFGGQTIRNYVLHPEQYVKDTRTGHRATNPNVVLDGELNDFLDEYLRWSLSG
jgi:peptide chain release factor 2